MPNKVSFSRDSTGHVVIVCGPVTYTARNVQKVANALRRAGVDTSIVFEVIVGLADLKSATVILPSEQWQAVAASFDLKS